MSLLERDHCVRPTRFSRVARRWKGEPLKRLFMVWSAVTLFVLPSHTAGTPAFSTAAQGPSFRQARDRLLMLGAMSYMYAGFAEVPSPGLDISAVIAWGVDDPTRTPEFLLDRKRNFEKQGDIFHAE